MHQVGTFEAKTHLTQLLDRVAQGEKIVITRRGEPIAMLVPPETPAPHDVAEVVRQMLRQRDERGPRLGPGLTVRDLIEEGRRF